MFYYVKKRNRIKSKKYTFKYEYDEAKNGRFARYFWQYLGMIERGKGTLSVDKLKILCDMTGLSADYILFGKNFNSTLNLSKKLSGYSDEEIKLGCATLENLALFLKHID